MRGNKKKKKVSKKCRKKNINPHLSSLCLLLPSSDTFWEYKPALTPSSYNLCIIGHAVSSTHVNRIWARECQGVPVQAHNLTIWLLRDTPKELAQSKYMGVHSERVLSKAEQQNTQSGLRTHPIIWHEMSSFIISSSDIRWPLLSAATRCCYEY